MINEPSLQSTNKKVQRGGVISIIKDDETSNLLKMLRTTTEYQTLYIKW